MIEPTQANLKLFTHYNPDTGEFKRIRRLTHKGNVVNCNFISKKPNYYGYLQMNIFGRPYHIHRLIFLWMNGELPLNDVDHINGVRTDNRWVNLREVTRMENLHNLGVKTSNSTGQIGVSLRGDTGNYHAYINTNNKRVNLGNFSNFDDAVKARKEAEIKYNFHNNHGERKSWVK